MTAPDWAWQDWAACRGQDLTLFFGWEGERRGVRAIREDNAKKTCRACPVKRECLDYALSVPEKVGVWGGLGEEERASERRRRQRRIRYDVVPSALPTVDEKQCHGCRKTLPAQAFPRDKRSSDGLNSRCKPCSNRAERQRRATARAARAEVA